MTRKLALFAFALGLTLAALAPTAYALPRYCDFGCPPGTPPSYPCTCPGTSHVTTCGQWHNVCGF